MTETDHDYKVVLEEQLRFLRKSCVEFDGGDWAEAKRIALTLRTLLHGNQRSSPAVLQELGLGWFPVVDSRAPYHPRDVSPYLGVTTIYKENDAISVRWDGDESCIGAPHVPLDDWTKQHVFDDRNGTIFTRLDLIRSIADQDGGAHVQRQFGPKYKEMFRKFIPNLFGVDVNKSVKIENVQYFAIRQIAHEVLRTFDSLYVYNPIPLRPGVVAIRGVSTFLLPGRRMSFRLHIRPQFPWDNSLPPLEGPQTLEGPMMKFPYEDTSPADRCCCGSDLLFRDCCLEPRDFPPQFLEEFISKHNLPVRG